MKPLPWTEAEVATVVSQWHERSVAEIARDIGRTYFAVYRKARDLNLPRRADMTGDEAKAIVVEAADLDDDDVPDEPLKPARIYPYHRLGPNDCRFPIGDPALPDFDFCGKRRNRIATPYCDHHHRIAYQAPKLKRVG